MTKWKEEKLRMMQVNEAEKSELDKLEEKYYPLHSSEAAQVLKLNRRKQVGESRLKEIQNMKIIE